VKSLSRVLSTIAGGALAASAAEPLSEGAPLPDASQLNHEGKPLDLSTTGASGWLLVYFYPKADTPGCTRQACSLRDAFTALTAKGVKVIGVSNDSPESQKAFREKFRLPFDLLADEDGTVTKAFGVPTTLGFTKRQAFLFKDGKLVWRDLSASTDRQAADVLKAIGN
jgi:thioredoxin-dependent peroxiredoxin